MPFVPPSTGWVIVVAVARALRMIGRHEQLRWDRHRDDQPAEQGGSPGSLKSSATNVGGGLCREDDRKQKALATAGDYVKQQFSGRACHQVPRYSEVNSDLKCGKKTDSPS